jgi:hypothetical protein
VQFQTGRYQGNNSLNRAAKSDCPFGEYRETQAQLITMPIECGCH